MPTTSQRGIRQRAAASWHELGPGAWMAPRHQQVPAELGGLSGRGGTCGEPEPLPSHPPSVASLSQTVSINKAINAQEVAVKEKHARNILPKAGRGTSERGSGAGAARKRGSSKVVHGERCWGSWASAASWLLGC